MPSTMSDLPAPRSCAFLPRLRMMVAALLLLPTVFFWIALVLREGLGHPALFDATFLPLDRDLRGKLAMATLVYPLPMAAVLLAALEFLPRLKWLRPGEWLALAIGAFACGSMAIITLHAIVDR